MLKNLHYDFNKYDFSELDARIKKFYPIGIEKIEGGLYHQHEGVKKLNELKIEFIHNKEKYKEWTLFCSEIGDNLNRKAIGTTYGLGPSLSCSFNLELFEYNTCTHIKSIHFSVSLLGNFIQIYGKDRICITCYEKNKIYPSTNVLTVSPIDEFNEPFQLIQECLKARYTDHKLVPYQIGQLSVEGLQVTYLNNANCTINEALFDNFLNATYGSKFTRGDTQFGIKEWRV